jgi:hypothetical protein
MRTRLQRAEPFPDLLINFWPIQQFHVVDGASDLLAGFRQREIAASQRRTRRQLVNLLRSNP